MEEIIPLLIAKKPIPTSILLKWIPHRPPMVWVDELISFSAEGGECVVHLNPTAHYCTDGKLRSTSLIEFIAQAQGFVGICTSMINNPKDSQLTKAFIVSISKVEFFQPEFFSEKAKPQNLFVRVETGRSIGPISMFNGSIWTESNLCLGKAQLKAFTAN